MEWDLFAYFSGRKDPPVDLQDCGVFKKIKEFAHSTKRVV